MKNNVDPATQGAVWVGWLRWCQLQIPPEARRHVIAVADALGLALETPRAASTVPSPRYPLCDREPQMRTLASRAATGQPLQRVLVHGAPAMGQRCFGLRCVLNPQELGVEHAVYVRLVVDDLMHVRGCWARLAAALQAPASESESDPRRSAALGLARRAAEGRLALVHSPLPELGVALDVLARYHEELATRLSEDRLSERVLVVQTFEEPAPTGLGRWLRQLTRDRPVLVELAPFRDAETSLVLPPLTRLTRADLDRFRDEVLGADEDARAHLRPDEILRETVANVQFRRLRDELGERDPIEP